MFLTKTVFNLTQTQWKTNYPNLSLELYYALQTPEYIPLNDTLQDQLNTLENAMSHNNQTNISSSGDLPSILDAEAIISSDSISIS